MRVLFLDIASHRGLIACITEERVMASRSLDHRIGDHGITEVVEHILKEAGWSYADLTQIACVVGPGGFMSLRVGVSFANALAWTVKIPSAGIHLSDVYAARAGVQQQDFLWFHSTKKHEIFVRGFGAHAKRWPEATLVLLEDFLKESGTAGMTVRWVGELLPEHEEVLVKAGAQHGSTGLTTGVAPLQPINAVLPQFLSGLHYSHQTLLPWYGRGW